MTAVEGVSFSMSQTLIPLTCRKDEAPSQDHESDMGHDGAGVLAVREIAHRPVGRGGRMRRRAARACAHFHAHAHVLLVFVTMRERGRE